MDSSASLQTFLRPSGGKSLHPKLLMWHLSVILWVYFLFSVLLITTCMTSEYNRSHCGGYFCPYCCDVPVMSSTVLWDRKRPDWSTARPAICPHWQLYQLHCSIIPSAEAHHRLCPLMQYGTVIGLLCWESPDLIRKGTWTLTTTPSAHLLSYSLFVSSPLLPTIHLLSPPSPPLLSSLLLWSPPWHLSKVIPVAFPLGRRNYLGPARLL